MKQTKQAKATLPFQFDVMVNHNKPARQLGAIRLLASALIITVVCVLTAARPAPVTMNPVFPHLTCTLPAPATLSADRTGSTTAYLEWSSVSGAESYSLKVYDLSTLVLVSSTVVGGTSTTVGGLDAEKSYRVVLASMCSAGSISEFVIVEEIADP